MKWYACVFHASTFSIKESFPFVKQRFVWRGLNGEEWRFDVSHVKMGLLIVSNDINSVQELLDLQKRLKIEKKDLKHQEQIIKRCLKREFSRHEAELEKRIRVEEMLDAEINTMAKVDVPENMFDVVESEKVENVDLVETMKLGIEAEIHGMEKFDDKVSHEKQLT